MPESLPGRTTQKRGLVGAFADGHGWAVTAVVLGALVSIAGNVTHSYIAPPDWNPAKEFKPAAGAVLGAVWWPLALFLGIEILARVDWRKWVGVNWLINILMLASFAPVIAVAAVVSYHHLSGLLEKWGEDDFTVRFGPVAVDGLMIVATVSLLVAKHRGHGTEAVAGEPVRELTESSPPAPRATEGNDLTAVSDTPDPGVDFPDVPGVAPEPWLRVVPAKTEPARSPAPRRRTVTATAARPTAPSGTRRKHDPAEVARLVAERGISDRQARNILNARRATDQDG